MPNFDDDLSPDPAENWRMSREREGFRPFRVFGPSPNDIQLRKGAIAKVNEVTVWSHGRRYAVLLLGDQFESDGTCLYDYQFFGGWFAFRKAMKTWGYLPPFWWWSKWPSV